MSAHDFGPPLTECPSWAMWQPETVEAHGFRAKCTGSGSPQRTRTGCAGWVSTSRSCGRRDGTSTRTSAMTSRSGREHAAHQHLCCARIIARGSPTTSLIERSRLPPTQTERSRSSSESAVTVPMLLNRWSSPIATASLCWVTPSGARDSSVRTSTGEACQSQTEECRHSHGHLILRRDPGRRPWP